MKAAQREAGNRLERLLSGNALTKGMYVRPWGNHLIIGRYEPFGPEGEMEADDRLRLTARNASRRGLSVRRHTGLWEKTPITGTLEELSEVIWGLMQHMVAPYS